MLQDLRAFQLGHALAEVFCPEKPELSLSMLWDDGVGRGRPSTHCSDG